jgi:hypothetical protein
MITHSFTIDSKRYHEFHKHIKGLKTVRYNGNPMIIGGKHIISIQYKMEDSLQISELFNRWHEDMISIQYEMEDSQSPIKQNWFKKIFGI